VFKIIRGVSLPIPASNAQPIGFTSVENVGHTENKSGGKIEHMYCNWTTPSNCQIKAITF